MHELLLLHAKVLKRAFKQGVVVGVCVPACPRVPVVSHQLNI